MPVKEIVLSSPTHDKENPQAPAREAAESPPSRQLRPFQALLRFRTLAALRHRDFRLIWYSQIFASMATWMDQVTRGWLIYELTDSALQLGLVRGVQAIPFLLLSPIAGSTADRYSRKAQVMIAQVVDGLLYGAIALLIFMGQIQPWHVYVSAFMMAIVQTFQQPSRAAMIADAVPPRYVTNAIGLNAIIFNVARMTGPALAGLLIVAFGTGGSYSVQALFYLLAIFWTIRIRAALRPSGTSGSHTSFGESFGRSIIEGWRFSWRNETVRSGVLIAAFASFFMMPFTTLLPVFARDILGVGATGQGLLLTAMGAGALGSSVLIASLGDQMPRGLLMLGGVTLYGFLVVVFAISPWFELSLVLMAIIGICHVTAHALVQTVIQTYSPAEFRGRTMAVFHMTQVVLMAGGMLIGSLASLWGAQWAAVSMSLAGVVSIAAIYIAVPHARVIR